jgi:hypothetical protein
VDVDRVGDETFGELEYPITATTAARTSTMTRLGMSSLL